MTTLSQRALILYRRRRFINQAPLYLKRLCIFGPKGAIQIRYYYYLLTYLLAYLLTYWIIISDRARTSYHVARRHISTPACNNYTAFHKSPFSGSGHFCSCFTRLTPQQSPTCTTYVCVCVHADDTQLDNSCYQ